MQKFLISRQSALFFKILDAAEGLFLPAKQSDGLDLDLALDLDEMVFLSILGLLFNLIWA